MYFGGPPLRMPFIGPSREEIIAVATDLIARFGPLARDEAQYLVEVATHIRSRRNRSLYSGAAQEIEKTLLAARSRRKDETSAIP